MVLAKVLPNPFKEAWENMGKETYAFWNVLDIYQLRQRPSPTKENSSPALSPWLVFLPLWTPSGDSPSKGLPHFRESTKRKQHQKHQELDEISAK